MLNIELSYVYYHVCDHIWELISSQIPAVDNIFKKVSTYFDLFPCDLRVLLLKHRDEVIEVHLKYSKRPTSHQTELAQHVVNYNIHKVLVTTSNQHRQKRRK